MQLTPMGCTQLQLEIPGKFQCSRASVFLQTGPVPTALYIEVYCFLIHRRSVHHTQLFIFAYCKISHFYLDPVTRDSLILGAGWRQCDVPGKNDGWFPLHLVTLSQHLQPGWITGWESRDPSPTCQQSLAQFLLRWPACLPPHAPSQSMVTEPL